MKVLKFGGSSVGSPEAIRRMVDIVLGSPGAVLVVSAFSGVTDAIIAVARMAATAPAAERKTAWIGAYDELASRHHLALSELSGGPRADEAGVALESLLLEFRELLSGVALLRELSPRSLDLLMSFGERLSATIVAAAFCEVGVQAVAVDAREIIIAEGNFGNARPLRGPTERAI
ncbi:MAG: bifunctional aspartate kinase/homoserine dehydrogenase I, partial [Spirochaetota bacterium]